jgi:imidazolonepropionase-like amidohydrolase
LILVDGDPLKDIAVLQDRKNIRTVIKDGLKIVENGKICW